MGLVMVPEGDKLIRQIEDLGSTRDGVSPEQGGLYSG